MIQPQHITCGCQTKAFEARWISSKVFPYGKMRRRQRSREAAAGAAAARGRIVARGGVAAVGRERRRGVGSTAAPVRCARGRAGCRPLARRRRVLRRPSRGGAARVGPCGGSSRRRSRMLRRVPVRPLHTAGQRAPDDERGRD